MKRFISYGSIEQFRKVVEDIKFISQYQGKDNEDNHIMDRLSKLPIITAQGTEKIHGTNAAVCYSLTDGLWVQSRNSIITIEKDNAGCAASVMENEPAWRQIIGELAKEYNIDMTKSIISIYFEWCGGNIQKNSAVTGLSKRAILFKHFKVSTIEETEVEPLWYDTKLVSNEKAKIFNINSFPTFEIDIDFKRPDLAQNSIVNLVDAIEHNSGVAKYFDKPANIGEGIVWTFLDKNNKLHRFKTKGEKHANSKVNKLKEVDSEKEQTKIDFANYATPAYRLEQAWQNLFGIGDEKQEPSIKFLGDFLRLVFKDIIKEESDKLEEKGLIQKEVSSMVSKISKQWFLEQLNRGVRDE